MNAKKLFTSRNAILAASLATIMLVCAAAGAEDWPGFMASSGIDDWRDGPFALCVPSVANFWPRRWYPPKPGENRTADSPLYTGDFLDGFGNRMTVFAVSNPAQWGHEPTVLHNRAPGYGIARFNRTTREVSLEAWPRWADPLAGDNPYPGWPVRFHQLEGYGRTPVGYLPTLVVEGMSNPVVQVISETGGGVIYTLRIQGKVFTPWTRATTWLDLEWCTRYDWVDVDVDVDACRFWMSLSRSGS